MLTKSHNDTLQAELNRRLLAYDEMFTFVNDLANWEATTDNWYDLFDNYRNGAKKLIADISVK